MEIPTINYPNESRNVVMRHADAIDLSNACRAFYQSRLESTRRLKERWRQTGEMEALGSLHDRDVSGRDRRASYCRVSTQNSKDKEIVSRRSSTGSIRVDLSNSESSGRILPQKSPTNAGEKGALDLALSILRKEMILLMDQDLCLMKQLLTLNEEIEELKWRRRHGWSRASSFCSSDMLQSASSLSRIDERPTLEFLTPSSLSLQLESSHVRLSVYNEDDPTGTFNRTAARSRKAARAAAFSEAAPATGADAGEVEVPIIDVGNTKTMNNSDRGTIYIDHGSADQCNFCIAVGNSDSESHNFSTDKDSCSEEIQEDWISDSCNDLMQIPGIPGKHSGTSQTVLATQKKDTDSGSQDKARNRCKALQSSDLNDIFQDADVTSRATANDLTLASSTQRDTIASGTGRLFPTCGDTHVCTNDHTSIDPRTTNISHHKLGMCVNNNFCESDAWVLSEIPPSSRKTQISSKEDWVYNQGPVVPKRSSSLPPGTKPVYAQSVTETFKCLSSEGDSQSQDSGIHDCIIITSV